jgi:Galactose oxidase, central domain
VVVVLPDFRIVRVAHLLVHAHPQITAAGEHVAPGSLSVKRVYHAAVSLPDGQALVTGGFSPPADTSTVASAELFDVGTGGFASAGNMTNTRWHHSMTLLQNGLVLIASGQDGSQSAITEEIDNPVAGTFSTTSLMNVPARYDHTATLLPNGSVLIAGGSNNTTTTYLSSAELFR